MRAQRAVNAGDFEKSGEYMLDKDTSTGVLGSALVFFFQAEDGIRDLTVTGVQTCALPISGGRGALGACPSARWTVPWLVLSTLLAAVATGRGRRVAARSWPRHGKDRS